MSALRLGSRGFYAAIVLLLAVYGAGCATISDEANLGKLKPNERIYVGRLKVRLNDDTTPRCEVFLNLDITPSVKLAPDGFLVYKTDRSKPRLRGISCYHESSRYLAAWHHQALEVTNFARPTDLKDISYFGDLEITWKIDPEQTTTAALQLPHGSDPYRVGTVKASGEMEIAITENLAGIENEFYSRWPNVRKDNFSIKAMRIQVQPAQEQN